MTSVFALAAAVAVQDYEAGHGALQLFNAEGQQATPTWVQYWLQFMLLSFALGLIFVWKRSLARWVVGGFVATIILATVATGPLGLAPLGGLFALIHLITWSPGYVCLWKVRPWSSEKNWYGRWSALITAVITFSFIFDIRDAAIYLDYMLGVGVLS